MRTACNQSKIPIGFVRVCPGKICHSKSSHPLDCWKSLKLIFALWIGFGMFLNLSQNKNWVSHLTCTLAFVHFITLSCCKVDLIQGENVHSILETFRISNACSKINLCAMSNNVPVCNQVFIVIWPKMNWCFQRCWQNNPGSIHWSLDQVSVRTIQLLSKVLEDFLKVLVVGDLHTVVVPLLPCKLVLDRTHKFPCAWKRIIISWPLENSSLDSGPCPALVSQCLRKQNSDPTLDSPGCTTHPNPTRRIVSRSKSSYPFLLSWALFDRVFGCFS